jgi:hypothetical protein
MFPAHGKLKLIRPASVVAIGLMLLCSCATQNSTHSRLPADVAMNKNAGRGGLLMVTIRLADGEKLPLVVDTGSQWTMLDKSLEPKLGKRLDTGTLWNFGVEQDIGVYAAPQISLGDVPLRMADTNIFTFDRQKLADHDWPSFMGFLGMNVLQNYCVQLDFAAGKMRFLDDKHAGRKNWGQPFPLTNIGDGCFSINENLAGVKGLGSMIDTGCNSSGWLQPELFRQWTNRDSTAGGKIHSPDGVLGGETYHDLDFRMLDAKTLVSDDPHTKINGIGLRVLAENLVTLDFPNRTMYLKRTSNWPLANRDVETAMKSAVKSSIKLLKQLLKRDQLPGTSKHDHGRTTAFHFNHVPTPYLDTATWDALKKGDSSIYHYTFARTAKNGPWKLKEAWRTDASGKVLQEYAVP